MESYQRYRETMNKITFSQFINIDAMKLTNFYDIKNILRIYLANPDLIIKNEDYFPLLRLIENIEILNDNCDIFCLFINHPSTKINYLFQCYCTRESLIYHAINSRNRTKITAILNHSEFDASSICYFCESLYDSPNDFIYTRERYQDPLILCYHEFEMSFTYNQEDCDIIISIMEEIMHHPTFFIPNYIDDITDHFGYFKKIRTIWKKINASKLFLLTVGMSDNYLKSGNNVDVNRFFNITSKLPMELQMLVSNITFNRSSRSILSSDVNNNLSLMIK